MKVQCQANSGHAKKTFDVVNGFKLAENGILNDTNDKLNNVNSINGETRKNSSINAPKIVLQSAKIRKHINSNDKLTETPLPNALESQSTSNDVNKNEQTKASFSNNSKEPVEKDALNQHLVKLRQQFSSMHNSANHKMLELQSELGKMQHMSHEFDVLAEFLTSDEKLSIFEQNLDRLQKTICLTEEKINQINTNNKIMGRMIRHINESTERQHDNNNMAINAINDRLVRWECKLDRVTRKIVNQKNGADEPKLNDHNYNQLKDDIESMLNQRLTEFSTDMERMKNVVICIISLIVIKSVIFDFFLK